MNFGGIQWHGGGGQFWFRVFGWGLSFADARRHPPLFSVRNGYRWSFALGRVRLTALKPEAM